MSTHNLINLINQEAISPEKNPQNLIIKANFEGSIIGLHILRISLNNLIYF